MSVEKNCGNCTLWTARKSQDPVVSSIFRVAGKALSSPEFEDQRMGSSLVRIGMSELGDRRCDAAQKSAFGIRQCDSPEEFQRRS